MNTLRLPAVRCGSHDLPVPARAHPDDAGIDLCLDLRLDLGGRPMVGPSIGHAGFTMWTGGDGTFLELPPGGILWLHTGWGFAIPPGIEGQVRGRSGLALNHGVTVWHVGTIDAGYHGEVLVALQNSSSQGYELRHGDRIAQLVLNPHPARVDVVEVEALDASIRSRAGFGSTGR